MHEIYLVKVPETLDLITQTAPITIMTRSPVAATTSPLSAPSALSFFNSYKALVFSNSLSIFLAPYHLL